MKRNGQWALEEQKKPYAELSENEKEKDRVIAREALRVWYNREGAVYEIYQKQREEEREDREKKWDEEYGITKALEANNAEEAEEMRKAREIIEKSKEK